MPKRQDYISWDEYFMGIALLSSMRSKDPHTQVGACIVAKNNRIVGVGYNGFPNGCSDEELPWERRGQNPTDIKYSYVIHAEQNAILNSTKNLKNAKLYITHFPCNECCKIIIQSGIKEIIYLTDKFSNCTDYKFEAAKKMMALTKVKYRQLVINKRSLLLKFN